MNITMDPRVRMPSTWRDPIGKLLTNRRITTLIREGWYGSARRQRLLARDETQRDGIVNRCRDCDTAVNVRYMTYKYLPWPGYYCPRCREYFKAEREKEKELAHRVMEEYA